LSEAGCSDGCHALGASAPLQGNIVGSAAIGKEFQLRRIVKPRSFGTGRIPASEGLLATFRLPFGCSGGLATASEPAIRFGGRGRGALGASAPLRKNIAGSAAIGKEFQL
jgi:hypothetical protein